jgi:hypothetical protein
VRDRTGRSYGRRCRGDDQQGPATGGQDAGQVAEGADGVHGDLLVIVAWRHAWAGVAVIIALSPS